MKHRNNLYNLKFCLAYNDSARCILLAGIFLCINPLIRAQTPQIPQTPSVAAMDRYVDIPVSFHTGVPDINIPLYTIQQDGLTIPISISYHAGGVKVRDIASTVGLGWTLNAGGNISRQMNGIADDHPTAGYFTYGKQLYEMKAPNGPWMSPDPVGNLMAQQNVDGIIDSEPDFYNYRMPGTGGKFVIDFDKAIVNSIPDNDLKIDITNFPVKIKITDNSGVEHYFDDNEETHVPAGAVLAQYWYKSSWYLTKMTSLISGQSINYNYDTLSIENEYFTSESKKYHIGGFSTPSGILYGRTILDSVGGNNSLQMVEYNTRQLTSIISNTDSVVFVYSQTKENLLAEPALSEIRIYDRVQGLKKYYKFYHSYWGTGNAARLCLDRLQEFTAGNVSKPAYEFRYNSMAPPAIISYAQDYWGYYNGATNTTLIPEFELYHKSEVYWGTSVFDSNSVLIGVQNCKPISTIGGFQGDIYYAGLAGANREVNPGFTMAGQLESIKYPTGGYVEFNYENNVVQNDATSYLDDEDYAYRRKMDYKKRLFGDSIMIDSLNWYQAFNVEEFQKLQEDTITINSGQFVRLYGRIKGYLGDRLDPEQDKIKR